MLLRTHRSNHGERTFFILGVLVLRDVEGLPAAEVCNILALTDARAAARGVALARGSRCPARCLPRLVSPLILLL